MAETARCPNANCQHGKVPCKHGFLHGHNVGTKKKRILCAGGTCDTCKGSGLVTR